jgi:hypothetical protein
MDKKKISQIEPITGAHLEQFRQRYALTIKEMCELLGIPRPKWHELSSQHTPIKDVGASIMIRLYERYPSLLPTNKPNIHEVYELLGGDNLGTRNFGILMGRDRAAGNKWINRGQAQSTSVKRICNALIALKAQGKLPLDELRRAAQAEAAVRNVSLAGSGGWASNALSMARLDNKKKEKP